MTPVATPFADLILRNALVATLDPTRPSASAVAVASGKFLAVGDESEVMRFAGATTKVIDAGGRRLIPGLIDSHIHVIPLDELNAVAPDTPVFILHLYDRALLNAAALRAAGYTRDTPNPPGGTIAKDAGGEPTGLLLAQPNALLLYSALARGPKLPYEQQVNSTRHFMRELNRLGLTSVIDAGGGFQNYPDDYQVIDDLHKAGQLTLRIAYNLFTQKPKEEVADFVRWTSNNRYQQGDDFYKLNGAGEMLVFSAADFEDFREPRPELPVAMENELEAAPKRFPIAAWNASPSWAAASPSSTAWPTRARISSRVMAARRWNAPPRSSACWKWASRSASAPMPPASPVMTPGMRCIG